MSYVYVTEPGATVHREGTRLVISRGGETLQWLPSNKIDQLVLMGPIHLTPAARSLCLKNGIDTLFLNTAGKYLGRLIGPSPAYSELRRQQYLQLHDRTFCLETAREIVCGKIYNQRKLMMKRAAPSKAATELRVLMRKSTAADSIDTARGYEGRAAAVYFGAFDGLITNPDFSFNGRNRQPPRDPVNILLSLGYTILTGRMESIVWQTGLDIALGSLHFAENGKPALALDLVEEFRPLIVDATVLKCVNLKIVSADDFQRYTDTVDYLAGDPDEPERPVRISREALQKFLVQLDQKFMSPVLYPAFGTKLKYRDVMLQQARLFIRSLKGEEPYQAFTPHG